MSCQKKVLLLGSTGSIGKNALAITDYANSDDVSIEYVGIGAFSNASLLKTQISKHKPKAAAIITKPRDNFDGGSTKLFYGENSFYELLEYTKPNIVLNAVAGCAGLKYTQKALELGIDVALANKESLIMGGDLVLECAELNKARLIPVDSEHSAIYQLLDKDRVSHIKNIYITGSGGPFRLRTSSTFSAITPEEALKHPSWNMGPKITIDSATLMNKGLEVIEAHYLFNKEKEHIKVLIHPESIIHGMLEFNDGTFFAQLAVPDMKGPIAYALTGERRYSNLMKPVDFLDIRELHFDEPDLHKFPLLKCAYEVMGDMAATIAMNRANEEAVYSFLEKKISFTDINLWIYEGIEKFKDRGISSFEDIYALDEEIQAHFDSKI